ncbi:signal peptidase I [Candidatus Woesearchaeota archaeon CG11_big_fil_rev_8_21_14_0_20_43_8]|nr:MAG: signal peptidase I [Candidatus Woesearchaeota archaeon CG11_big_fil_rev_8_21_14_0_20_43_8]PIO06815.1 MAG: signal peptidase I [Candidatus Woesearchaeota archaeon CG08_land_8_20_14_0_20_43_7]
MKRRGAIWWIKRFWDFLWNDDSLLSWVANIIVAFLLIKFIIYPGLGLLFGTSFPIVAVVSGSMEHDGSFDDWWASEAICQGKFICRQADFYTSYEVSKSDFKKFDFHNGFNTGDIMVLFGKKPEKIQLGDVVVFRSAQGEPIIHRIIKITRTDKNPAYQTKGDHNTNPISSPSIDELDVEYKNIIGKAVFRIPYLGWIKILFFKAIAWVGGTIKAIFI